MRVWFGSVGALAMVAVLLVGCGGGTKTVTQTTGAQPPTEEVAQSQPGEETESLGGLEPEAANYPKPAAVGKAIVDDIEARYGDGFEGGQCENFAPEFGGTPVYICEIKMGGEWHTIEATIHPDGSFEWVDSGGSPGALYEGDELSVTE